MPELNVLVENLVTWVLLVVAFFATTEVMFTQYIKPMLQEARDYFELSEKGYAVLMRVVKVAALFPAAYVLRDQLDVLGNVFGYTRFDPAVGAMGAAMVAAFFGRYLHDWAKRKQEGPDLGVAHGKLLMSVESAEFHSPAMEAVK